LRILKALRPSGSSASRCCFRDRRSVEDTERYKNHMLLLSLHLVSETDDPLRILKGARWPVNRRAALGFRDRRSVEDTESQGQKKTPLQVPGFRDRRSVEDTERARRGGTDRLVPEFQRPTIR